MSASHLKLPVSERDHIQGRSEAPVTLVEYGDYECPHCGRAHSVVKRLQKVLGGQMRFVFRNFPLTQVHPHAEIAAEVAEAAGSQDHFWEMHDTLFEHQDALDPDDLVSDAKKLGLNTQEVIEDLTQRKFENRVSEDLRSGLHSGVNGTPTFFINGIHYDGLWDFDSLLSALQAELAHRTGEAA
jgi:protein-disulfide isomerase